MSLRSIQSGASATGPGPCQPPRKQAAAIAEITITSMYSAMKNEPKRMPPYSVLYPPTISASPSGRSNGARAVSAKPATMKMQKPTNWGTTYHMCALRLDDVHQRQRAGGHRHAEQREAERHLVGDQLRGGAHGAQERVLGARGPAAEHEPVEAERAEGEEVEEPDRHVDAVEAEVPAPGVEGPERDDRERGHRGDDRDHRRDGHHPRHRRVRGDEDSFESSLNTSASGCMRPFGPTRLGPIRDWKRPSSLRSSSRMSGHDLEHEGEDHDRLHDHHERALHQEAAPSRGSRSRAARDLDRPLGQHAGRGEEHAAGRHAGAHARGGPRPLARHGELDLVARLDASARASSGASSACGVGARKLSDARVLDLAARPERGRGREQQLLGRRRRRLERRPSGSSSSGSAARRLAVLPAHAAAADLVERQPA